MRLPGRVPWACAGAEVVLGVGLVLALLVVVVALLLQRLLQPPAAPICRGPQELKDAQLLLERGR